MISEKTVELNLTAELLSWLYRVTRQTHFVIAPSARAESKLGFDAGFYGHGPAVLIQFKRAHVQGSQWVWHLNKTRLQDQHQRLQQLEAAGIPVFYAFPHFHRVREVAQWRMQLVVHTFWVRPSAIRPPGGPTGPHDLMFDDATHKFRLSSPEPIEISMDTSLAQIATALERSWSEERMSEVPRAINAALFNSPEGYEGRTILEGDRFEDLADGLALVGRAVPVGEGPA